jgi:FAD/FMN-containing dehydrogenase
MCDRSEIRFEGLRRIGISGASGQLHCGADIRLERHQHALTAAGWLYPFNLCAIAAILEMMFLFNGLLVGLLGKFRTTSAT